MSINSQQSRRQSSHGDVNRAPPQYCSHSSNEDRIVGNLSIAQTDAVPPTDLTPPPYSSVFNRSHTRRASAHPGSDNRGASSSSVPRPDAPHIQAYHIKSGGKNWATLKVKSWTSVGSSSMPLFMDSDLIQGSLELNLETPQNINSVSVSLRGRVITSSYEGGSCTFLDHAITAWARSNGDPRLLSSTAGGSAPSSSSKIKKFDGKLSGNYSWPFSFSFPQEVAMNIQGEQQMYPIPQSLLDSNTRGNVQYELVLRVTHGILRPDSKLHVGVVYIPGITPAPFSSLRQVAYENNMIVPRPDVDPSGWHTLPPVAVKGQLLANADVELHCTLSLANPRSYTRGTVIPCHISIKSNIRQALDLLANPKAIAVRLTRCVQHVKDAGKSRPSASFIGPMLEDKLEVERAVWWFNQEADDRVAQVRQLEGEIHLEKELQPSCSFPLFKVSYTVELLPFESPAFLPAGSTVSVDKDIDISEIPLVSLPVIIATLYGAGPAPVTFTKPKPRSSRTKADSKPYKPNRSMDFPFMT